MKRIFSIGLLLGLFCSFAGWPQDASPSQVPLDQLSSSLLKTLEDSKNKIASLRQSLTTSFEALNQSKAESETLKAESNLLRQTQEEQNKILMRQSESLLSINEELTSSFMTIENYKTRLKTAGKWIAVLAGVCILFLILKATAIILRVKIHVKLPWIVDVLV
jgi:hypothetical protein